MHIIQRDMAKDTDPTYNYQGITMNADQKMRVDRNDYRNAARCGNCKYLTRSNTSGTIVLHCSLLAAPVKSSKVCNKHILRINSIV